MQQYIFIKKENKKIDRKQNKQIKCNIKNIRNIEQNKEGQEKKIKYAKSRYIQRWVMGWVPIG